MELKLAENPDGKFYVYEGDYIGDQLLVGERWEPWVLDAIAGCADDQKIFIDVGAFIGTHTVFAARCYKHVHAFEPYPAFAEVLRRNIELNGLDNVTVHEVALGNDGPRTVRMFDFDDLAEKQAVNLGGLSRLVRNEERSIRVPQQTLDSFRFRGVGAIKIDTQGTEYRVLRGASTTLIKCKPIVFLEGVQRQLEEHRDSFANIRTFLRDHNYQFNRLKKNVSDFMVTPKRGSR